MAPDDAAGSAVPMIRDTRNFSIGIILWLCGSFEIIAGMVGGVEGITYVGAVFSLFFIGFLIWLCVNQIRQKIFTAPVIFTRVSAIGFYRMLFVIITGILILFVAGFKSYPQGNLIVALDIAAILILAKWKNQLKREHIALGIFVSALCIAIEYLTCGLDLYVGLYLLSSGLMAAAGALLLDLTGFSEIPLIKGRSSVAIRAFGMGCVLAVPAALLNVMQGSGKNDVWIQYWYDPIIAIVPGISEEVWARLFLTTLIFALLLAACPEKPRRAAFAAIVIGALTHCLAHFPAEIIFSPSGFMSGVFMALLYGIPMGLLFVSKNLEHAVGYHFFVDFLRFISAYLQ